MNQRTLSAARPAALTRNTSVTQPSPQNSVNAPANQAEANALVETINRGVADLRQRFADRETQHGADLTSIRGELANHATQMANIEAALQRFNRPQQPATAQAQNEERLAAFSHWLRTGDSSKLEAIEVGASLPNGQRLRAWAPQLATRAQQGLTSNGPYGGYILLDNVSREIDRIRAVYSNMRDFARVISISQGDRWNERTRISGAAAARTTETATRTSTDALQWAINEVVATEAYAEPVYSRQALADPFINLESEIFAQLGEAYGLLNAVEHVSGSGVGEPEGFMNPAKGTALQTGTTEVAYGKLGYIKTGHATAWGPGSAAGDSFDVFVNLQTALKPQYLPNARYFMNRVSLAEIMLLKDSTGLPIWQPSMQAGSASTLRGYPVALIEHMDSRAAGKFPVAFGDMRQYYTILDRVGMDMQVNPYKTSGFVTFETWMRDGAKVMKSEALKAIKVSA